MKRKTDAWAQSEMKPARPRSAQSARSGNVFADLGLPDTDTLLLKSRLVGKIDDAVEKRGLTEAEAGSVMGLAESQVAELRRFRCDYTVEHLQRFLEKFGERFDDPNDPRAVRAVKLDRVRNEIARMRRQIHAQEREIRMLQRAKARRGPQSSCCRA